MSMNNVSFFDVNRCESRHAPSRFGVSNCTDEDMDLDQEMIREPAFEGIVGQSAALRHVLDLVETVAPSDSRSFFWGKPEPEKSSLRGPFINSAAGGNGGW